MTTRQDMRDAIWRNLEMVNCHGVTAGQAVDGIMEAADQYAAGQYARDLIAARDRRQAARLNGK